MDEKKAEWILSRLESILDRWDKPKYTIDNLSMLGLIAELRQLVKEETVPPEPLP